MAGGAWGNMRKKLIIVCCAALAVIAAALVPHMRRYMVIGIEEPAQESKITLRFASSWGGRDPKSETIKYLFGRFMDENKDIEIINESVDALGFNDKLAVDIASGNSPDLILANPGYESSRYIREGKFCDLTGILKENSAWKESFDGSIWYDVTYEGNIYGVPLESVFQCMYVNKDLFEAYDLSVPDSFEGLLEVCRVFSQHGIIPIAYSFHDEDAYMFQNLAAKLGGRFGTEKFIDGDNIGGCYREALDYLSILYKEGAFPQNVFNMTYGEAVELFVQKQAAMIVGDTELIGDINSSELLFDEKSDKSGIDMSIDMIPFPYMKEGGADATSIIFGSGVTMYMGAETGADEQKRSAAVRLMKYLTSEEAATRFAEYAGMFVSTKSVLFSTTYYNGLLRKGSELINNTKELVAPPGNVMSQKVWSELVKQIPFVVYGTETEEDMWNGILREFKLQTSREGDTYEN